MVYEDVVNSIQAYAKCVAEHYHPRQIIVYGSYARGTATEDSDIDIAVVCESLAGDFLENASRLFRLRRDIDLRIEPILIELNNTENRFYDEILKTGKVIYAA